MDNKTMYGATGLEGLSPAIWGGCPMSDIRNDNSEGILCEDEFMRALTFTSATGQDGYRTYQDTGVTIKGLTTSIVGELEIAGNDADNDEGSITGLGNGVCPVAKISTTAGSKFELWFEGKIKKASIANNGLAFFFGLATTGGAVADILADDTGILKAAHGFVGFQCLQADGDALLAIYQKTSETKVAVDSTAAVLVADTYVKLGLHYDGDDTVTYFVDGASVGTVSLEDATVFPDGTAMAMLFATKVGTNSAEVKSYLDWWKLVQRKVETGSR